MEIFKKVDVIVSPTTGWVTNACGSSFYYSKNIAKTILFMQYYRMTAPKILPSALISGETNLPVTGILIIFINVKLSI